MTVKLKTTRTCAGEYKVSNGERSVSISQAYWLAGNPWIAQADWDTYLTSDPVPTLRDAKESAAYMLAL